MQIPAYWSRRSYTHVDEHGDEWPRSALGWSFTSQAEADQMAQQRAEQVAKAADEFDGQDFYYDSLPIREPVLDQIDVDGQTVGLVTRNRYGCRVLNAESVLFADIDLRPAWKRKPRRGLIATILSLFGLGPGEGAPAAPEPDLEAQALDRIGTWCGNTGIATRVYRTFAGLRLMVTDRHFEPSADATTEILQTLQSDPLYVQLTKRQDCFRARLSPKPWRIGVANPAFPSLIEHPEYPQTLARWAEPYELAARAYATCRLLRTFGQPANDPAIQAVIQLHDAQTFNGDRPLA